MNPLQAVLFDYGMVLSGPPDPAAWARIRTITGLSEDLLHREYWAHRHAYDRGDLTANAYWNKVADGAAILLTPQQITAAIAADVDLWSQLNTPMLEFAQRLQQAGIRTGILSNIGDAMTAGLLEKHVWLSAFDHLTWSYALNLAKPEPAIYRHAAEGLRTPPENILFIDDKSENIAAARAVGMQAIQYTSHDAFEKEMRLRGLDHLLQLDGHTASQIGKL
jgi:putative hydrolase of the HAD superfamily